MCDYKENDIIIAHQYACNAINLTRCGDYIYGWHRKSCGAPVHMGYKVPRLWLKVLSSSETKINSKLWTGEVEASSFDTIVINKPRSLAHWDYNLNGTKYRALIMSHIVDLTISKTAAISPSISAPSDNWFQSISSSLEHLKKIPTSRIGYSQELISRRINERTHNTIDTTVKNWVTNHCDLHWANVTTNKAIILDWEAWGMAPKGTDEALLLLYSCMNDYTFSKVQNKFKSVLETRDGYIAILFLCSELIRMIEVHDDHPELFNRLNSLFQSTQEKLFNLNSR